MSGYTKVNLKSDVEDMAPKFGMQGMESRFAKQALQTEQSGVSYFKLDADVRPPFGHKHAEQEEVYVIISGSARIRIEDDEIDLDQFDAIRVAADQMRAIQGGPNGCELLAFGAPRPDYQDAEMVPGWWEKGAGA
jgi:mannose-6-phosphate isomerase-like protein (cupin superfamily)